MESSPHDSPTVQYRPWFHRPPFIKDTFWVECNNVMYFKFNLIKISQRIWARMNLRLVNLPGNCKIVQFEGSTGPWTSGPEITSLPDRRQCFNIQIDLKRCSIYGFGKIPSHVFWCILVFSYEFHFSIFIWFYFKIWISSNLNWSTSSINLPDKLWATGRIADSQNFVKKSLYAAKINTFAKSEER